MFEDHYPAYRGYTPRDRDTDGDQEGRMEEPRRRHPQTQRVWSLEEVQGLMMGRGAADNDWGSPANTTIVYKIGIYGWRKRCLYVFILLIMVTVIVNLALTVWILKVMDFSVHGMGQMRITDSGIRVEGQTEFLQGLHTSGVHSPPGSPLTLESSRNITLNARNKDNKLTNRLVLGDSKISSYAKQFELRDSGGKLLFSAAEDEVNLAASTLDITGSGVNNVKGSIQTSSVRAASQHLRLESPTRSLLLSAPEGVTVQSERGDVDINSSGAPVKIESLNQVTLEGRSLRLKSLQVNDPQTVDSPFQEVYQLCICADSGKLFLVAPQGTCQATGAICD